MATSGSFLTNAISGGGRRGRLRFSWTSTSSVANNTSSISWTLKGVQELAGWQNAENFYVVVDGTRYTSDARRQLTEGLTVLSGTTVVTHNAAGARSFTASAGAAIYNYGTANSTGSGTYTLNTIPRASNITSFSRYAYSAKILDVQCTADKHFDQVSTRVNGGAWTTISVGSRTSHNWSIGSNYTPGTTYKVELQVRNTASGIWSSTSTINIKTARLSTATMAGLTINASNVNTTTNVTVTVSQELAAMTNSLALYYKTSAGANRLVTTVGSGAGGARTVGITAAMKQDILTNTRTSTSVNFWVDVTTLWYGANEGTLYSQGMTKVTITPSAPSIGNSTTYLNATASHVTLLGSNQYIIGGKSTLRTNYSGVAPWGYGNIASVVVTIGKTTASTTSSSASGYIDIANADAHGTVNGTIRVTDSRGASSSRSFSVRGLPYAAPQVTSLNPEREYQYEAPTWLKVNLRYNALDVSGRKNTITASYRVKQNPSGAWGAWQNATGSIGGSGQSLTYNINQYMTTYPTTNEYTVEFRVEDKITGFVTTSALIRRGIPLLKFQEASITAGVPLMGVNTSGFPVAGRYHLGMQRLGVSTNLNNLVTEGTYYTPATADASTMGNRPPGQNAAFSIRVELNAGVTQFLTDYQTSMAVTYVRNFYNGTWGPWGVAGLGGTIVVR